MPVKKKVNLGDKTQFAAETSNAVSRAAMAAGIRLTEQDAAWAANKLAQRRVAVDLVRKLPYSGYEPASTVTLRHDA